MKKLGILYIILFQFLITNSIAQPGTEKDTLNDKAGYKLSVGYSVMFNNLNNNNYYEFKHANIDLENQVMHGLNIQFIVTNQPFQNIDLVFGTIFLINQNDPGSTAWSPGNTNSYDYSLNGGGVYAGINPRSTGKVFGITTSFAFGVFSFKEYVGIFNNQQLPYIDIYHRKASYGLGALSSIGIYLNIGKIGINPSIDAIYSGGAEASFLLYGFVFPMTYTF